MKTLLQEPTPQPSSQALASQAQGSASSVAMPAKVQPGRRHFAGWVALLASGLGALFLRSRKSRGGDPWVEESRRPVWPKATHSQVSIQVRPNANSVKRHG